MISRDHKISCLKKDHNKKVDTNRGQEPIIKVEINNFMTLITTTTKRHYVLQIQGLEHNSKEGWGEQQQYKKIPKPIPGGAVYDGSGWRTTAPDDSRIPPAESVQQVLRTTPKDRGVP